MKAFRPQLLQLTVLCIVALGLSAGTSSARRSTVTHPAVVVIANPNPIVVSAP